MTIIVHFIDTLDRPAWLDGPFTGSGHCYPNSQAAPPRDGWQVVAKDIPLEKIKAAIYQVDEMTALHNLAFIGCDLQTTPPDFRRRATDQLRFPV